MESLILKDKTEQNIKKNMQKIVSFFIFPPLYLVYFVYLVYSVYPVISHAAKAINAFSRLSRLSRFP